MTCLADSYCFGCIVLWSREIVSVCQWLHMGIRCKVLLLSLNHCVWYRFRRRRKQKNQILKHSSIVLFSSVSLSSSLSAESTHRGVNQCLKYVIQVQRQRPESPMVTLTWHVCKYKVHKLHRGTPSKRWLTPFWVDSARVLWTSFCFIFISFHSLKEAAVKHQC